MRELRNIAERLILHDHTGEIMPADLPTEILGISRQTPHRITPAVQPSTGVDSDAEAVAEGPSASARVDQLWDRLVAGHESWWLVQEAFKHRELTRTDLIGLVDRGLRETRGSYRQMLRFLQLNESDYKRFHSFLYQAKCNLPVARYRQAKVTRLTDFVAERLVRGHAVKSE